MKDTKFHPEDAPRLAEQAMRDVCTGGNPRPVTVKELENLYLKAYRREV
jgi:alcohol dehydrogenase class IV